MCVHTSMRKYYTIIHLYYICINYIYGEQTSVCVGQQSECAYDLPWLIYGCYAVAMSNCPCIRACIIDRTVLAKCVHCMLCVWVGVFFWYLIDATDINRIPCLLQLLHRAMTANTEEALGCVNRMQMSFGHCQTYFKYGGGQQLIIEVILAEVSRTVGRTCHAMQ